jgi:hypothetical protein
LSSGVGWQVGDHSGGVHSAATVAKGHFVNVTFVSVGQGIGHTDADVFIVDGIVFVHKNFTGHRIMDFQKSSNIGKCGLHYHARFSTKICWVAGSKIFTKPCTLIDPVSLGLAVVGRLVVELAGGCAVFEFMLYLPWL